MRTLHLHAVLAALAALAVFAALAVAGCAKSPKDAPGPARTEFEAPGEVAPESRFSGTIAGHRFTIAIEGGRVTRSGPDEWRWAVGAGEVAVQELGPADADTHFLVERSPRTIVRGDRELTVVTEVVLVAGGRVFRCAHQERVDDPEAPAGKAAVERGIATCASLRVEP